MCLKSTKWIWPRLSSFDEKLRYPHFLMSKWPNKIIRNYYLIHLIASTSQSSAEHCVKVGKFSRIRFTRRRCSKRLPLTDWTVAMYKHTYKSPKQEMNIDHRFPKSNPIGTKAYFKHSNADVIVSCREKFDSFAWSATNALGPHLEYFVSPF